MTKKSKIIYTLLPVILLIVLTVFNVSRGQRVSTSECGNSNNIRTNINCYFALALQNNDFLQCFNIGKWANNTEARCLVEVFQKISQTERLDYSVCEKPFTELPKYPESINAENYWKTMCLFGIGSASKDDSVCQRITTNDSAKQRCECFADGECSYKQPLEN